MWRRIRDALIPLIFAACISHPVVYAATPVISSLSQSSGFPGATVTITGHGFTSDTTVLLGQIAIPHAAVSQTTLVFTVPDDALLGPYNVLVQNATGFSNQSIST
jgi:IPT/TIG domain-containing protein